MAPKFPKLKPCPFCGVKVKPEVSYYPAGEREVLLEADHKENCIFNTENGCYSSVAFVDDLGHPLTFVEMARRWNTRTGE